MSSLLKTHKVLRTLWNTMLPAGGSCLLGSINLSAYINNPFKDNASIALEQLSKDIDTYVRELNNVLDEGLLLHPLAEQQESVKNWRQIGLGIMGFADALIKMGITYGSFECDNFIKNCMHVVAQSAVLASLELAKEKGCYPKCQKDLLTKSSFIKNLHFTKNILDSIKTYGLHNSQLLTIAPTGSLSSLLQISSGAEPNYAFKYIRKTISLNNKDTYYEINAPIIDQYIETTNSTEIPEYFIPAEKVEYNDRLRTQGILNKYIDASISSTLNIKEESTIEDVYNIYIKGWEYGLKGCTIWRNNCYREGILTKSIAPKTTIEYNKAPKRPEELEADFYTIKYKGDQFTVVVGLLDNKPYEVFAYQNNLELNLEDHKGKIIKVGKNHYRYESKYLNIKNLLLEFNNVEERAATLYPSQLLRHGVDIKYIIKTMKKVNDNITSFTAAICRVLSKYIPKEITGDKCPNCGSDILREGGCQKCTQCEWSKCE